VDPPFQYIQKPAVRLTPRFTFHTRRADGNGESGRIWKKPVERVLHRITDSHRYVAICFGPHGRDRAFTRFGADTLRERDQQPPRIPSVLPGQRVAIEHDNKRIRMPRDPARAYRIRSISVVRPTREPFARRIGDEHIGEWSVVAAKGEM